MAGNYQKSLYKDYEALLVKNESISKENDRLKYVCRLWQDDLKKMKKLEEELESKSIEIEALKKEIGRLIGITNADGTNSGTPTSKTPINKKKVIPNSRTKSGKKIGGQPGHAKKKLERFTEDELTDYEEHALESCPCCNGTLEKTGEVIEKDEFDYEVVVKKMRHVFHVYQCVDCEKEVHQEISRNLKEENQYGPRVQALSLTLMNQGNVSINKVKKIIYGLSECNIDLSEGYIAKLQARAGKALTPFVEDVRKELLNLALLYWDDTVIDINKKRACLRFYGDEKIALYKAHAKKDKIGIDSDLILNLLPQSTTVMHDHNKVNYNPGYSFTNIECNVHLLRDLQRVYDNLEHSWALELKNLLILTDHERNLEMEKGEESFGDEYVKSFFEKFDKLMLRSFSENRKVEGKYYADTEETLMNRILKYKDNYFMWVVDFDLPFSNNLSERAQRGVKTKMKVSGQFQNEVTAGWYANIKTYMETCYRNGINEMEALMKLCTGEPYTVKEVLGK